MRLHYYGLLFSGATLYIIILIRVVSLISGPRWRYVEEADYFSRRGRPTKVVTPRLCRRAIIRQIRALSHTDFHLLFMHTAGIMFVNKLRRHTLSVISCRDYGIFGLEDAARRMRSSRGVRGYDALFPGHSMIRLLKIDARSLARLRGRRQAHYLLFAA